MTNDSNQTLEWRISDELINYPDALSEMEARVKAIRAGEASELVWLLEHPPLGKDVRKFIYGLEEVMIQSLSKFGVTAERRDGRVGVWVERGNGKEDKIGAIGVRIRQWVTYHGIALNVEPDLSHFEGIVPCGITEHGVTSLHDLGLPVTMDDIDVVIQQTFDDIFGLETQTMDLSIPPQKEAKMPFEAMPTETGTQDISNPIEETHPVFQI